MNVDEQEIARVLERHLAAPLDPDELREIADRVALQRRQEAEIRALAEHLRPEEPAVLPGPEDLP